MTVASDPRNKPYTLLRAKVEAHRSVAHDAAALIESNPLLPVIQKLRHKVLERVLPRFRRAWRKKIEQRRRAAQKGGNERRVIFLNHLEATLDDAPGLENDDGREIRRHALETVWPGVRDEIEADVRKVIEELPIPLEMARERLADVESGFAAIDDEETELIDADDRIDLEDFERIAAMNALNVTPSIEDARTILNLADRLLEAWRRSQRDEPNGDGSAARCLLLQRTAAILASSQGERVPELVDRQDIAGSKTKVAKRTALTRSASTDLTVSTPPGRRRSPRKLNRRHQIPAGSHPLRQRIQIAKDRHLADRILEMLVAPGDHALTGAEIRSKKLTTSGDDEEAARTAYNAIKRKYPAAKPYLRFRKSKPAAVGLVLNVKQRKLPFTGPTLIPPKSHQTPTAPPPTMD